MKSGTGEFVNADQATRNMENLITTSAFESGNCVEKELTFYARWINIEIDRSKISILLDS
jgi:hypothetical protein